MKTGGSLSLLVLFAFCLCLNARADTSGCEQVYLKNFSDFAKDSEAAMAIAYADPSSFAVGMGTGALVNYDQQQNMKAAENIVSEAKSGGGNELWALQDSLAKKHQAFAQDQMSHEKFRQLILALDEAKRFCSSAIGDTSQQMTDFLNGLSDPQIRQLSSTALDRGYVDANHVNTSDGLMVQGGAAR